MNPTDPIARLDRLMAGAPPEEALAFYDSLPTVPSETMIGQWRGADLPTGHVMDGLLGRYHWYGKRFDSAEAVHPLVFSRGNGSLYSLNPTLMPMGLIVRHPGLAHSTAGDVLFKLGALLLATTRPQARLRMTAYRGVVSATMIYDRLPINDVFRLVSQDIVVGAMDIRGMEQPYMFVLHRDQP